MSKDTTYEVLVDSAASQELTEAISNQPSEARLRAEMDAVFAYKNLLGLEDHLKEFAPQSTEESAWLELMLEDIERIRSHIMPEEKDSRYHCMAKHASAAVMALEELVKAYRYDDSAREHYKLLLDKMQLQLLSILEKLWGHEIENCKRCK